MKYRRKPIEFDVIQWTGENNADVEKFLNGAEYKYNPATKNIFIFTLEGLMECTPQSWIVKGIKGEFWSVKPDIFEQTYEVVDE